MAEITGKIDTKQWVTFRHHLRYFKIFNDIDSFLKNVLNVLYSKKVRLHFWKAA